MAFEPVPVQRNLNAAPPPGRTEVGRFKDFPGVLNGLTQFDQLPTAVTLPRAFTDQIPVLREMAQASDRILKAELSRAGDSDRVFISASRQGEISKKHGYTCPADTESVPGVVPMARIAVEPLFATFPPNPNSEYSNSLGFRRAMSNLPRVDLLNALILDLPDPKTGTEINEKVLADPKRRISTDSLFHFGAQADILITRTAQTPTREARDAHGEPVAKRLNENMPLDSTQQARAMQIEMLLNTAFHVQDPGYTATEKDWLLTQTGMLANYIAYNNLAFYLHSTASRKTASGEQADMWVAPAGPEFKRLQPSQYYHQ